MIIKFGKYCGKELDKIPADYLMWLYKQDFVKKGHKYVVEYINKNKKVIEQELASSPLL